MKLRLVAHKEEFLTMAVTRFDSIYKHVFVTILTVIKESGHVVKNSGAIGCPHLYDLMKKHLDVTAIV